MTDISIVVVSYNSAKHLPRLLDSIAKSPDKLSKEVIVVDNASSDKSASVARQHRLKPIVIANKTNLGFSKAVNIALAKSTGQYIFLLNPDTKIIGGAISILYNFAQKTSPLGAVAPRLVDPNKRSQASAFYLPTIGNALLKYLLGRKNRYGKYLPPKRTSKVDVAVMAAFFMPRSTIETVGYLDERFFLYYEDIEFCRRLKRAKLPVYYLPQASVMHIHGASGNFTSHAASPLYRSALIYHGRAYFKVLNLVLWLGQKLEKAVQKLKRR
jgi:GT2 family glycosyltransferase